MLCALKSFVPTQLVSLASVARSAQYAGTKGKSTVKVHAGYLPQIHVYNAHANQAVYNVILPHAHLCHVHSK
ncbi:unnamed protein product [Staurois parvus]|uniref:Secreted protein n=1 Tax=Staurois parvus TaxID=386267 RepID=A0ABN9BLE8_9NEOB|nr:unnamed protein product [Staurois parvus]